MSLLNLIRKHAELLYEGRCTVTEFHQSEGIINNTVAIVVAENVPCRVSYKSIPHAEQNNMATTITQSIKLFISPEIIIKAGSEIIVTQNGTTITYKASGESAMYVSHQEVELTLKERWA